MKAGFALWDRPAVAVSDGRRSSRPGRRDPSRRLARLAHPAAGPGGPVHGRAASPSGPPCSEPLSKPPPFLAMWGLDGVDALAAALAAYRVAAGHGFVVAAARPPGPATDRASPSSMTAPAGRRTAR